MGGLGGWLSPILTAGTNLVGAYQGAQADAADEREKKAAAQIQLLRQQHNDEIQNALRTAQTGVATRTAAAPVEGSPAWLAMKRGEAGAAVEGATPGLVAREDAMRPGKVADAEALIKPKVDEQAAMIPGKVAEQGALTPGLVARAGATAAAEVPAKVETARQTADFAAPVGAVDPVTGQTKYYTRSEALGLNKPDLGGKSGMSGSAQNMQARLLAAVSEGRLADERMDKFVAAHTKDGKLDVSSLDQIQGNAATNLASSHKLTDIVAQGLSEGHMNNSNPEYMQFLRDARLISRAEQLMSARGGSEAMANENAFLARGGANAPLATLEAASKTRKAMFGKLGAVMQTLTPEQQAKLAAGLEALNKDDDKFDYAGVGQSLGTAATAPTPGVVTPSAPPAAAPKAVAADTRTPVQRQADKVRAAKDPHFKQWLVDHGLQP